MPRRLHTCPGCGEGVPSLLGALFHCDPMEPIDDIDDGETIIRGDD